APRPAAWPGGVPPPCTPRVLPCENSSTGLAAATAAVPSSATAARSTAATQDLPASTEDTLFLLDDEGCNTAAARRERPALRDHHLGDVAGVDADGHDGAGGEAPHHAARDHLPVRDRIGLAALEQHAEGGLDHPAPVRRAADLAHFGDRRLADQAFRHQPLRPALLGGHAAEHGLRGGPVGLPCGHGLNPRAETRSWQ